MIYPDQSADEDLVDLADKLLVYRPSDRLSCMEALGHPFFDGEGPE